MQDVRDIWRFNRQQVEQVKNSPPRLDPDESDEQRFHIRALNMRIKTKTKDKITNETKKSMNH